VPSTHPESWENAVAAQRIVLTSPWRLGLFVFLLVVGTGFGLIYAYIELFGWKVDLQDAETVRYAYMVLGGVAVLGLLGYISVVSSARPLDRVVRGSKARDQAIKRLGKISDPRDVDLEDFDDEPAIMKVLERWADDAETASSAQLAVAAQREAVSALVTSMRSADGADVDLDPEYDDPDLSALVDAINEHARGARAVAEDEAAWSAPQTPVPDETADAAQGPDRVRLEQAVSGLSHAEVELRTFVQSVAEQAERVARTAHRMAANDSSGAVASGVVGAVSTARQNAERVGELRRSLEVLAEESNKLAITMALQISRLGEPAAEMLDTAEDVRSLSTKYQRIASDLRMCESEQASTLSQLQESAGPGSAVDSSSARSLVQESMVLDQNAEALREVLGQLQQPLAALRDLTGIEAPSAPAPAVAASQPAPAFETPVASAPDPAPEERIYELAELGGREVDADAADHEVRDLSEFGAIEL